MTGLTTTAMTDLTTTTKYIAVVNTSVLLVDVATNRYTGYLIPLLYAVRSATSDSDGLEAFEFRPSLPAHKKTSEPRKRCSRAAL